MTYGLQIKNNDNDFGNPLDCDPRDPGDQYEPTEWWYVNVTSLILDILIC